jgi:hypothetical protein
LPTGTLLSTKDGHRSQRPVASGRGVTVLLAASRSEQACFRDVGGEPGVFEHSDSGFSQSPSFRAQAGLKADLHPVHEHLWPQCSELGGAPLCLIKERQSAGEISSSRSDKTLVM